MSKVKILYDALYPEKIAEIKILESKIELVIGSKQFVFETNGQLINTNDLSNILLNDINCIICKVNDDATYLVLDIHSTGGLTRFGWKDKEIKYFFEIF